MTLGGLRDATSFHNGSPSPAAPSSAKKDRRAMLEEWRKQVRAREGGNATEPPHARPPISAPDSQQQKRARTAASPAPLAAPCPASPNLGAVPPPSPTFSVGSGGTALERFKLRQQQRLMREAAAARAAGAGGGAACDENCHSGYAAQGGPSPAAAAAAAAAQPPSFGMPPLPPAPSSSICLEDDMEHDPPPASSSLYRTTPLKKKRAGRMSLAAGAARRPASAQSSRGKGSSSSRRRSVSASRARLPPQLPPQPPAAAAAAPSPLQGTPTNPASLESPVPSGGETASVLSSESLTQESAKMSQETTNTVEEADLRSRVSVMQQRITQLERDKMALSMSKAPLEARFRQKEDAWTKEQHRMLQEIESLKAESRERDDLNRQFEERNDRLEGEIRSLRLDARKAASTLNQHGRVGDPGPNGDAASGANDAWNRQLQNDRDVADLKEKLRHSEEEIKFLRLEKVSVESELGGTQMELSSLTRTYAELSAEYEELEASKAQNSEAEIQLEVLTAEHIATSAQLNAVCADLAATKSSAQAATEAKEGEHKKEIERLKFEMSVLKARGPKTDEDVDEDVDPEVEDPAVLKARIEERDRRITELELEVLRGEKVRRQMHNRIQELRGNIRVFVRARPFLPGDGDSAKSCLDVLPDGESLSINDVRSGKPTDFKFDKIFAPSAGQDAVFEEVSEFVQSALDGYNVCLFSYGQTGSGKTHTMQGSGNGAMRGIIPRAVEQVLSQAKMMQDQKWTFTLSASFLEIYNENLRDLLVSLDLQDEGMRKAAPFSKAGPKLSIKHDADRKSYVDGLTKHKIDTENSDVASQQLQALMAAAGRARSVATTKMNAQSSRSHSVFMLHLYGSNSDSGTSIQGSLNLCDLAGSERLDRSGAAADARRLKETQAINKSLSCLGDVFNALGNGSPHIPFRNSKLTYLLQDCLSGEGKAMMMVNLSPTTESGNESLCSLRFAQRVNSVELGKATKHITYNRR